MGEEKKIGVLVIQAVDIDPPRGIRAHMMAPMVYPPSLQVGRMMTISFDLVMNAGEAEEDRARRAKLAEALEAAGVVFASAEDREIMVRARVNVQVTR